jgi:hypothetical protein
MLFRLFIVIAVFLFLSDSCSSLALVARIVVPPSGKTFAPLRRRDNTTFNANDTVDLSNLPQCAAVNCITSHVLTPSRMGCTTPRLTKACLCEEAVSPLSCAPDGPEKGGACWYDLEDWFLQVCDGHVTKISPESLPRCAKDCVLTYLNRAGCRSPTKNCFCSLTAKQVIDQTAGCLNTGCPRQMASEFSLSTWHDRICLQNNVSILDGRRYAGAPFDYGPYNRYKNRVRGIQIGITVLISLLDFFVMIVASNLGMDTATPIALAVMIVISITVLVPIWRVL